MSTEVITWRVWVRERHIWMTMKTGQKVAFRDPKVDIYLLHSMGQG